ncbi:hypothetical protein MSAN_01268400 [Mycena sanguinolenta]|uniref:Uncharacterized protein n=1 Tax=Mycena sanguinolenta TaxID=230812 RepID=A0A8H7D542_9AGAR|nr:hypothetical protein MSAN_01268400 [Mycena sanguinolenta]
MSHKPHRSAHPTAVILAILLVLLLPHPIILFLAQATAKSQTQHSSVEGRWLAVRRSLHLPPLAAQPKPRSYLPPLSLHISSRFDLKRKRTLEESATRPFSFADVDAPPQLYFAADALDDDPAKPDQLSEPAKSIVKSRGGAMTKIQRGAGRVRTAQDK